jgi:hypothetical protein
MTDDDDKDAGTPSEDDRDIPPLSDTENPLADPDASEDERREWVPPIP